MSTGPINAEPTKELFIKTLIKDLSITEAILDLIDNAIDGYQRHKYKDRKEIKLNIGKENFEIWDNCGGISIDHAKHEVFRFGIVGERGKHSLGVYGIGLKRSMFKIGSDITFESDDLTNYFRVKIDLEKWKNKPGWSHEFDELSESKGTTFTNLCITQLHDEIQAEFDSNTFKTELGYRVSKTYFLFMQENVDIYLNTTKIEPLELQVGFSEEVEPANKYFEIDGVKIKLTAGAHPDYNNPGWYIFCNNRLIILGDTTSLTGWGDRGVPQYHNKYNRFKGFAYLDSDDPRVLPWTTAKNGIDTDSTIYIAVLREMQAMTQQYTSYMTKAYPTEPEETIGKRILGELQTKPVQEFKQDQNFKAREIPERPIFTTINYSKRRTDVDKLKKCMGNKTMSNRELGERTFEYYKEMECPDEE